MGPCLGSQGREVGVRRNSLPDIGHVLVRVDVQRFAHADDGEETGRDLGTSRRSCNSPIIAPDGDGLDLSFDRIRVEFQIGIGEEDLQGLPLAFRVGERFAETRLWQNGRVLQRKMPTILRHRWTLHSAQCSASSRSDLACRKDA